MPKLPRISGIECRRALMKLGFEEVRQRGSRVVMKKGGIGCVVPMHREIKAGTLAGILRQADVSTADFFEAL